MQNASLPFMPALAPAPALVPCLHLCLCLALCLACARLLAVPGPLPGPNAWPPALPARVFCANIRICVCVPFPSTWHSNGSSAPKGPPRDQVCRSLGAIAPLPRPRIRFLHPLCPAPVPVSCLCRACACTCASTCALPALVPVLGLVPCLRPSLRQLLCSACICACARTCATPVCSCGAPPCRAGGWPCPLRCGRLRATPGSLCARLRRAVSLGRPGPSQRPPPNQANICRTPPGSVGGRRCPLRRGRPRATPGGLGTRLHRAVPPGRPVRLFDPRLCM